MKYKYQRKYNWRRRGLNVEEATNLIETIKYCQICGKINPILHLDHDHKSGRIRGVLCHQCNRALGFFKDDPQLLRKAADYLEVDKNGRIVYN